MPVCEWDGRWGVGGAWVAVVCRALTAAGGLVAAVGVYTQGAILHVLATKAVRIHYLCLTPGPTDFQFELTQARRRPLIPAPHTMHRQGNDHLLLPA